MYENLACAQACYTHDLACARAGATSVTAHADWPCACLADQTLAPTLCSSAQSYLSPRHLSKAFFTMQSSGQEACDKDTRLRRLKPSHLRFSHQGTILLEKQVLDPPEPFADEADAEPSADEANAGTLELEPAPLHAPHVT